MTMAKGLLVFFCGLLLACGQAAVRPPPEIRFQVAGDETRAEVVVTGAPGGTIVLRRRADPSKHPGLANAQPVVGRTVVRGDALVFVPLVPLVPGETYRASLSFRGATWSVDHAVPANAEASAEAEVVSIHPTTALVPANLLKLYVTFSRPMEGGTGTFTHIRLRDETTQQDVPAPWRTLDLWSSDGKVLTLLPHPGRVKRDIPYAVGLGEVLHEGHQYLLRIEREVRDDRGAPLARSFEKRFVAGPADRERPSPSRFSHRLPRAGTHDALEVDFGETMEHALLMRAFVVKNDQGALIAGRLLPTAGDRSARFVPDLAWPSGRVRVEVDPEIEDLAGNTPRKLFDAPVGETHAKAPAGLARDFVLR